FPECLPSERAAAGGHEQITAGPALQNCRPALTDVIVDRPQRLLPDRYQALLIALAGHPHDPDAAVQIPDADPAQLRYPDPRRKQQLEHRAIPQPRWLGTVDRGQNLLDLLQTQELRNGLPLPRGAQVLGRILLDLALAKQKAVEITQRGQASRDRSRA